MVGGKRGLEDATSGWSVKCIRVLNGSGEWDSSGQVGPAMASHMATLLASDRFCM